MQKTPHGCIKKEDNTKSHWISDDFKPKLVKIGDGFSYLSVNVPTTSFIQNLC